MPQCMSFLSSCPTFKTQLLAGQNTSSCSAWPGGVTWKPSLSPCHQLPGRHQNPPEMFPQTHRRSHQQCKPLILWARKLGCQQAQSASVGQRGRLITQWLSPIPCRPPGPQQAHSTGIPRSSTMLLAAGNLPDYGCRPWEADEPGVAVQGSLRLGLLGGHTDVQ